MKLTSFSAAVVALVLSACTLPGTYRSASVMNKINVDMTKAEVVTAIGEPDTKLASGKVECYQYELLDAGRSSPSHYAVYFDAAGKAKEVDSMYCSMVSLRQRM